MATDWQVSEVGVTCRAAAGPGRRRSVQIEWLSAGTAHLGFPALLSVPHLFAREIKMNRRHCSSTFFDPKQKNANQLDLYWFLSHNGWKMVTLIVLLRKEVAHLYWGSMQSYTQNLPSPSWILLLYRLEYLHKTWHICSSCSWLQKDCLTFFKIFAQGLKVFQS